MSGGTDVQYNGIILHNVLTRQWKQDVRYDPTKTNAVGHTYDLTFTGYIATEYINSAFAEGGPWIGRNFADAASGTSAVDVYRAVRNALLEPRRRLIVEMNDNVVLDVEPCTALSKVNRDIDNGPKPVSVLIEHVASDKAFRVTFSIQCTVLGCEPPSGQIPFVLSNRWAVSETIDSNIVVTRTIRGRMIVSNSQISAHSYKYLVVPTLEKSFRRESIRFEVQEDGLAADYEVTDRQVDHAAPWPAQKMDVVHSKASQFGATFASQIHVVLDGYPGCPRGALLIQALRIADARMNLSEKLAIRGGTPSAVPTSSAVIEHFGDTPRIELRMELQETPSSTRSFLDKFTEGIDEPLRLPELAGRRYDWQTSWEPGVYGHNSAGPRDNIVLLTLSAYLQNPCGGNKAISHASQGYGDVKKGDDAKVSSEPTSVIEYTVPRLSDRRDQKYSNDAVRSVFTYSKIISRYLNNTLRVQLPIADFSTEEVSAHSVVAILSRPQGQKIILMDVERAGAWPKIHPPYDLDTDGQTPEALLDHWLEMLPPQLASDGRTYIYRVRAYYKYALAKAKGLADNLHVGSNPYTNFNGRVNLRDVYGL